MPRYHARALATCSSRRLFVGMHKSWERMRATEQSKLAAERAGVMYHDRRRRRHGPGADVEHAGGIDPLPLA